MGEIMIKKHDQGEEYINKFPKLKKWINECLCCHKKGYNPSMPAKITVVDSSLETYYVKKYFKPLSVNKDGICEQCQKILNLK